MHMAIYQESTNGVGFADKSAIEDAVKNACDSNSYELNGVSWSSDQLAVVIRKTDVSDIASTLDNMDAMIQNLNDSEGTNFPLPSETARIEPQG